VVYGLAMLVVAGFEQRMSLCSKVMTFSQDHKEPRNLLRCRHLEYNVRTFERVVSLPPHVVGSSSSGPGSSVLA
jgi:hypothetical protein